METVPGRKNRLDKGIWLTKNPRKAVLGTGLGVWDIVVSKTDKKTVFSRPVVAKEDESGGGIEYESAFSICKLLYIECISNKILLYNTENYLQYPVINHNGKEYVCIYVTESLCCTAEFNTSL